MIDSTTPTVPATTSISAAKSSQSSQADPVEKGNASRTIERTEDE